MPSTQTSAPRPLGSAQSDSPGPRPGAAPGVKRSARVLAWSAAGALVAGSLMFLAGGRGHPAISAAIGAGPDDFFRAFAAKVLQTPGWGSMHLLILLGPLVWAAAAPALLDTLRPDARALTSIARSALLLSGALWAVAFVLDGFGAPVYAEAIAGGAGPDLAGPALTSFRAIAIMMSRLGLVSWIAGGLGIALLGGSLLGLGDRTRWHVAVGVSGILIGVGPLLAALQGEYAGGPFISRFWMMNALAVGLWYLALATCAFGRRPRPAA
ncbi:MAG: hypothetical protein ACKVZ0_20190 [Gemmatimonadales bacterium]